MFNYPVGKGSRLSDSDESLGNLHHANNTCADKFDAPSVPRTPRDHRPSKFESFGSKGFSRHLVQSKNLAGRFKYLEIRLSSINQSPSLATPTNGRYRDDPRLSIRISDKPDIKRYPGLSTDQFTSGMSSTVIPIAILPCFE